MSLGSLGLALPRACLPTHTRASRPASTKPASTSLTTWSASAVVGGKFAAAGTHLLFSTEGDLRVSVVKYESVCSQICAMVSR